MSVLATEADNSPIGLFRAKIAERIRNDIGELMPDELLQEIIKQSIDAELKRPVSLNYGTEPWLQKLIREQIGNKVQEEARRQVDERKEEISAMMAEEISKQMPAMMGELFVGLIRGQSFAIQQLMMDMFNRSR